MTRRWTRGRSLRESGPSAQPAFTASTGQATDSNRSCATLPRNNAATREALATPKLRAICCAVPAMLLAWLKIARQSRLKRHHTIQREELSVREHMGMVLKRLQGRRFVGFEELFDPADGVPVLVVTFIALLELGKETLIEITQAEAFAPIYVRLAYTPN